MSVRLTLFVAFLLSLLRATDLRASDIPEVVRKAKPAVVEIITTDARGNVVTGTGFFITPEGLLLTNYHVIKNARTVGARTPSGAYYPFTGEWTQLPNVDIAMLKFNANDVPYLLLDSNAQVEEGQRVLVIGSPEGLQGTVSDGLVAAIRENGQYIQITAPISHGSSGSPVLNEQGQVIGVATSMLVDGQNLNFAISSGAIDFAINKWASASASTKANSENRSNGTQLSEHTRTAIEQFVVDYIKAGESNDDNQRNQYFASVVSRFYEHTNYSRSQIRSSDQQYYRKWPVRSYLPIEGTFAVQEDGNLVFVTQVFSWTVMNPHQRLSGKSKLFCTIRFSTDGQMEIVGINEQRLN
jgi:V8-like Glu-specific endopeptidase